MGVVVAVPGQTPTRPPASLGWFSSERASTWSLGRMEAPHRRPLRAVVDGVRVPGGGHCNGGRRERTVVTTLVYQPSEGLVMERHVNRVRLDWTRRLSRHRNPIGTELPRRCRAGAADGQRCAQRL
jgi:hypothetical protein